MHTFAEFRETSTRNRRDVTVLSNRNDEKHSDRVIVEEA